MFLFVYCRNFELSCKQECGGSHDFDSALSSNYSEFEYKLIKTTQ